MPTPLTEPVLRALVGEARRDEDQPRILAVSASPQWSGEAEIVMDWGRVHVSPCISALAARDAVAGREIADDTLLVILTDRSEDDLGQEFLARIWRHRLQRPSRWEAAKQLFRVERLDPALADARWLVELLVEVAPARGYPPPPSGFLDITTAWKTLLRHGLRLDVDQPTLADLLRWGVTVDARSALDGPVGQQREAIAERLAADAGSAVSHVLRLISEGRGADLVPMGLICDMLWSPELEGPDNPDHVRASAETARIRFETPLGSKEVTRPMTQAWAAAAVQLFGEFLDRHEPEVTGAWSARAEALMTELDAIDLAAFSRVLSFGFEQRLIHAGRVLATAIVDSEGMAELEHAVVRVEAHSAACTDQYRDRVGRLQMAARLSRWIHSPPGSVASDLATLATAFVREGAWVDSAREALSHGENVSALSDAYGSLISAVDERRRARDLAFANALAEWSNVLPTSTERLVPVERVLEHVVAPLARQEPVLLLVLDGLSYPESIRLASDLRGSGWIQREPEGSAVPIAVAALPTLTMVSRASLLTGSLVEGGQEVEREGFTEHPALRAGGGKPPRLFHKKDLKVEHGHIAPEVTEFILDTENRVVGVVVNAVDDHLEKGSQLRLADGLRALRPLRPLLNAAAEAGRIVILASDHGHVLDNGCQVRPVSGGGERWRPADSPPKDDEVEIAGPRVLRGGGRIVAAGIENIRYIPMEKRGYHGGATPQEVLCPLVVMTTGNTSLEGWESVTLRRPEWWEPVPVGVIDSVVRPPGLEPAVDPDGQGVLFPESSASRTPAPVHGWVEAVLLSDVLSAQRASAGRQALDEASVRAFLEVLAGRSGVAPPAVLADTLHLPTSRLRTKLEALRRLLNVEGYPVLTIETDGTARLNIEMLRTQFEVPD